MRKNNLETFLGLANGPLFRKYSSRKIGIVGGLICAISITLLSRMESFTGFLIFFSILYGEWQLNFDRSKRWDSVGPTEFSFVNGWRSSIFENENRKGIMKFFFLIAYDYFSYLFASWESVNVLFLQSFFLQFIKRKLRHLTLSRHCLKL